MRGWASHGRLGVESGGLQTDLNIGLNRLGSYNSSGFAFCSKAKRRNGPIREEGVVR